MALFEKKTLFIDATNAANGVVPFAVGGVSGATAFDMISSRTSFDGLQCAIQITGGAGQAVVVLQESADGTTAVAGGTNLSLTVTGAEGVRPFRYASTKGGRYIIGNATVTGGPLPLLRVGVSTGDARL
jgi:hypothetical protein